MIDTIFKFERYTKQYKGEHGKFGKPNPFIEIHEILDTPELQRMILLMSVP